MMPLPSGLHWLVNNPVKSRSIGWICTGTMQIHPLIFEMSRNFTHPSPDDELSLRQQDARIAWLLVIPAW